MTIPKAQYRHLLKNERILWERYLDKYPNRFEDILYDVQVGAADVYTSPFNELGGITWTNYVAKRIDVVARADDRVTLIEVKTNAGVHAVGQLLCYRELYMRKWGTLDPISLLLVTDLAQADMYYLCERFCIELVEVL